MLTERTMMPSIIHLPRSLRFRLAVAIAGVVLAAMTLGMIVDYSREYSAHLNGTIARLEEQARSLAAARQEMGDDAEFERFVDDFCAQMNQHVSPGHHVLILNRKGQVLIRARHHSGAAMEDALLRTDPEEALFSANGHHAAQYRLPDGDTMIVLAQYLDHMEALLRRQLVSRAVTTMIVAVVVVLLIYLLLHTWAIQPLARIVQAAKSWARRDFSVRSPVTGATETRFLAEEFNAMAEQLEIHSQRHEADLARARSIQTGLLPSDLPPVAGLHIVARYRPAEHVAGDLYDIIPMADGRTAFVILDVSGHGVSAALLTGVAKMTLRWRLAAQDELPEVMAKVNGDLLGCLTSGRFVTIYVGIWCPRDQTWTYCAAGHPGGLLQTETGARHLPATGPLVGAIEDACWTSNQLTLHRADRLWLYTDGITDAGAPDNALGDDGFKQVLDLAVTSSLQDQADALLRESTSRWSGDAEDDATLLAVECIGHREGH